MIGPVCILNPAGKVLCCRRLDIVLRRGGHRISYLCLGRYPPGGALISFTAFGLELAPMVQIGVSSGCLGDALRHSLRPLAVLAGPVSLVLRFTLISSIRPDSFVEGSSENLKLEDAPSPKVLPERYKDTSASAAALMVSFSLSKGSFLAPAPQSEVLDCTD